MSSYFIVTICCILLPHILGTTTNAYEASSVWRYECKNSRCEKLEITNETRESAISLPVCKIFCGNDIGTLWPLPSEPIKIKDTMTSIDIDSITFQLPSTFNSREHVTYLKENEDRFKSQIKAKSLDQPLKKKGKNLIVDFKIKSNDLTLNMDTDETYKLKTQRNDLDVVATIEAKTFYGARHALETLSQLVVYDDIRQELQIVDSVEISDGPAYKHRGLLLDTSRNYFSVESIKKTIDAMALAKLNTFHWHITDSQSFPLVLESQPDFAKYGAYSSRKVYTSENIKDIVNYARVRGVRVIPEFDAPAHVGEGWQKKDMTACFNLQPWDNICVEPPCGQLDPTVDNLYNVLEDIYREMLDMFGNPDVFHMGGDEVSTKCWNSSERIRSWMMMRGWEIKESNFMKLWGYFQEKALERVDKVSKTKTPIILWTSSLTESPYIEEYLNTNRYIIQIWTTGDDPKVRNILQRGFKIIVSNYDALYFDCGGPSWVADGNNWCSPYIGWQKIYMNDLKKMSNEFHSQVLGAEATIWSEQIDERNLHSRFWPRASAMAERLWSNPNKNWREAEARFLMHRERLVENGVGAEALQPEWCIHNEGQCPVQN